MDVIRVQVYKEGNWSPVFVDDRIPCNVLGKPAYSTSRSDTPPPATWQDSRPHTHRRAWPRFWPRPLTPRPPTFSS